MDERKLQTLATTYRKNLEITNQLSQLFCTLKKRMLDTALDAELSFHLNNMKVTSRKWDNTRKGYSSKVIATGDGPLTLRIPFDTEGTYQPWLVKSKQTHIMHIDSLILPLYAKGIMLNEVNNILKIMYDSTVSPALIVGVSNAVSEMVADWQNRTLNALYPVVYFDVISINVCYGGKIIPKSILLVLGINQECHVELMGMWQAELTRDGFWLRVLRELRHRGLNDIGMACVESIEELQKPFNHVYPKAHVLRIPSFFERYAHDML